VPAQPQLLTPVAPLETAAAASAGSKSWMQEMFNYPDITGSVPAKPKESPKESPKSDDKDAKKEGPANPPPTAGGTVIPIDQAGRPASAAERALLERLQERRQELDARSRDLELRESLLKEAEKKLEAEAPKAGEVKESVAAQRKEATESSRFKAVVTMYETMKPKDAAKIFDRLDIRVLIDLASQIKPAIMAGILAQMSAEAAERLTVELAARGGSERGFNPSSLPKIEGKPDGGG
jgi:flagellar motility protein MotE (MotC chaperone)